MTIRAALTSVILSVATLVAAQQAPTLAQLVDRMGVYLTAYEAQLSSVVADERFEQRIDYGRANDAAEDDIRFGEPGADPDPGKARGRRSGAAAAWSRRSRSSGCPVAPSGWASAT